MRVFLAGASGVIGQQLIPRLIEAGHVVGGMTRSPNKMELLSLHGAEPIPCDVSDRAALVQAVRVFKPDTFLNELTDLPDDVSKIGEHAGRNDQAEERTFEPVNHSTSMMDDLATCASTGKTPRTDGVDGLNDLRVIEAVYESIQSGKPVKLS